MNTTNEEYMESILKLLREMPQGPERQRLKTETFALRYGMGPKRLADVLITTNKAELVVADCAQLELRVLKSRR